MRRKKGFSYLEVLVAISLVSACALIVAATLPVATAARGKAALANKAMALAQKQLETIRGLGYAGITAANLSNQGMIDSSTPLSTVTGLQTADSGSQAVSIVAGSTYTFSNVDSGVRDNPSTVLPSGAGYVIIEQPATNLKRITVTVTYQWRGSTRTFSTGTLIANI